MLRNAYRALHMRSSENYPCCNVHRPCIPVSRLSDVRGVHGSSAYQQASVSGGIRSSGRSIPEPLHILPVLPQFPVQIHDTRYLQTFCPVRVRCRGCSLFCRSENPKDPDKSFPCQGHVLPLQMHSVFSCWSFRRSEPHFFLLRCQPGFLFSFFLSVLLPDRPDK